MDIKMFIEFPGILITVGVLFLIASIILGVIAYKKSDAFIEGETIPEAKPSKMYNEVEEPQEEMVTEEAPVEEMEKPSFTELNVEEPEEKVVDTLDVIDEPEYSFNAPTEKSAFVEPEEEEIELL